jgi:hypothetical protein
MPFSLVRWDAVLAAFSSIGCGPRAKHRVLCLRQLVRTRPKHVRLRTNAIQYIINTLEGSDMVNISNKYLKIVRKLRYVFWNYSDE